MSIGTPLSLRHSADRLLRATSLACALAAAVLLLLILVFLTQASWPLLQQPESLLGATWQPAKGLFGLQAMLGASLLSSLLALLLAVPAGLLVNVWLIFYAPSVIARGYGAMLGLMASIPSVVYGLWGLVVLAAGVVLALMILPLSMVQADVALRESARRGSRPRAVAERSSAGAGYAPARRWEAGPGWRPARGCAGRRTATATGTVRAGSARSVLPPLLIQAEEIDLLAERFQHALKQALATTTTRTLHFA